MSKTTVATRRMLFCLPLPMKRFCRRLLVLGSAGRPLLRPPGSAGALRPPRSRAPPGRRPAHARPTITTSEESGLRRRGDDLPAPHRHRHSEPALVPALATSWTVSADGLSTSSLSIPRRRWEDGNARDLGRRALHDRAGSRSRRPTPPTGAGGSRTSRRSRRPTRRPCASASRSRTPSACSRSTCRSSRRPPTRTRRSAADTDRHPVGSGPYRLASWESNQKIRARAAGRRSEGRQFRRGRLPRDPGRQRRASRPASRGELDEFRVTRDQQPRRRRPRPDFLARNRMLKVPQFLEVMLIWNCSNPFSRDAARAPRARARVAARGDRRQPLPARRRERSSPARTRPGVPENAPDVRAAQATTRPRARRLLDEAGWKAGPDGIRRKGGTQGHARACSSAPGQRLRQHRRDPAAAPTRRSASSSSPRPLDWAAYTQRADARRVRRPARRRGCSMPPNLDPFPYYHSSQFAPEGQNSGFYSNPEADRLMESRAARARSDAKRIALYRADPPPARRRPAGGLPLGRRPVLGRLQADRRRRALAARPLPLPARPARLAPARPRRPAPT